jgi:hypothetical protein
MKKRMITALMTLGFLLIILSPAFGEVIILQLIKKTDLSVQDSRFLLSPSGTGQYPGYSFIYAGDVYNIGNKIGEFTASSTKTTYAGDDGWVMNYDIVLPLGGPVGEFISIRAARISADGSGHGTIYATSPALKSLIGYAVEMTGDTIYIPY